MALHKLAAVILHSLAAKLRFLWLLPFVALSLPVSAQIFLIDQQTDPQPVEQKDNVMAVGPRQTFVPGLNGIDFAGFYLNNYSGTPGQVSAHVLDGLNGSVLGTSAVLNVPGDNTFSYYDFIFPSRIPLTPGQTYALHLEQLSGGTVWICHVAADTYSPGTASWGGGGLPFGWNFDFNFREGIIIVPEPAPGVLISFGLLALLPLRRKRHSHLGERLQRL